MLDTRWLFLESDDEELKKDKKDEEKDEKKKDKKSDHEDDDKKEKYNDLLDSDNSDDDDELPYMDDDDDELESNDYNDMIGYDSELDNEDDSDDGEYNTLIVSSTIDDESDGDDLFSKIANAGYACVVAASNMNHIKYLAFGKKFDDIRRLAIRFFDCFDYWANELFEIAMQSGLIKLDNRSNASKHCEDITVLSNSKYNYDEAISLIKENVSSVIRYLENARSSSSSRTDIQNILDKYIYDLNKEIKYFMARRTEYECNSSMEESYNFLF